MRAHTTLDSASVGADSVHEDIRDHVNSILAAALATVLVLCVAAL